MNLLKAGLLFSLPTAFKLLAGLFILKIVALYLGSEGLGKFGQFMSLMAMISTMAAGGISTGIVKYVAELKSDTDKLTKHLQAATLYSCIVSGLILLALLCFSSTISKQLFNETQYGTIIETLAFIQLLISATSFITALINGQRKIAIFAYCSIASVIFGAIGFYYSTSRFGFEGAAYGLMWFYSCQLIFVLAWFLKQKSIPGRIFAPRRHTDEVKKFFKFSIMNLTTVCTMQFSQIMVRSFIENKVGWEAVGYWQGVSKISDAYLQFFTIVLANYYMPKLSAHTEKSKVIKDFLNTSFFALLILSIFIPIIFIFKQKIILIVFSEKFSSMSSLFAWQLTGDSLRLLSYIVGFIAVAKAATKLYILGEIIQATTLITTSYLLISRNGLVGSVMAYSITYAIYAIISLTAFAIYSKKKEIQE